MSDPPQNAGQNVPDRPDDIIEGDLIIAQPNSIVAAGTDDSSDGDSALGEDEGSFTHSLRASLLESVIENGRGYHRYTGLSGSQHRDGDLVKAIDFADEHPDCQVLGTDLSPIQPVFVPPNCRFEIDDMDEEVSRVLNEAAVLLSRGTGKCMG
ncbi:hypothetical protein BST61_g9226 [Cercospora zeina]